MQEEYIKDEQKNLKKEFLHAQEEVKRIQSIPLVIGQFLEAVDQNTAIVGSTTGADGGAGLRGRGAVHGGPGPGFAWLTPICLSPAGSNYYVRILSTIDRELLKPNASVALHKHSNALVDVLPPEADSSIMMLTSGGCSLRQPQGQPVPQGAACPVPMGAEVSQLCWAAEGPTGMRGVLDRGGGGPTAVLDRGR